MPILKAPRLEFGVGSPENGAVFWGGATEGVVVTVTGFARLVESQATYNGSIDDVRVRFFHNGSYLGDGEVSRSETGYKTEEWSCS